MKAFLSKGKSLLQEFQDSTSSTSTSTTTTTSQTRVQQQQQQPPHPTAITPPTPTDLIRYRYHHGTNLGSIFVLERWLTGSMFPSDSHGGSSGGSELDAVTASVAAIGLEATRQKWESHWRAALSDADLSFLAQQARCTSIRLPIGYFTLGPAWCAGTPFERVGGVYANAWAAVRELVARARAWGIGVLVDFHAVQGGANGEEHSGSTSGRAELWGSARWREEARRALGFVAREVRFGGMDGVVGIQVVNEATHGAAGMYEWYEDVIREIGSVDEGIPIYISDAWDLGTCLSWTTGRHPFRTAPRNPIVIDTHRYYTFSDDDRSKTPQELIGKVGQELAELDGRQGALCDRGEAQIVVGEWSCVLDGQTWSRVRPEEKDDLVKQFGHAQSQKWQQRSGGSFFWTYKMDWMEGGEWGFAEQTKKGNTPPPHFLALPAHEVKSRSSYAQGRRAEIAHAARSAHENYWNGASPGKRFEHHLYSEGWEVGFSDAQVFFTMRSDGALGPHAAAEGGGDTIGCLEIWVKKRQLESGQRGEFVWEWEQGFRAGVSAFYQCVGI